MNVLLFNITYPASPRMITFKRYFFFVHFIIHKITGLGIPCIYHEILGWHCPGCGISRMFFSMMELDFYQAFRFNPLLFILFPFGLFLFIDAVYAYLYERETKYFKKIPNYVWIILLFITVIFGVIRNIEPFTYLAPTEVRGQSEKVKK